MAGRQPYIMIAFGQRGSGKTAETMEEIYRYVYQSPKRKALIFDVTNEFKSYRGKDFDEAKNNCFKRYTKFC